MGVATPALAMCRLQLLILHSTVLVKGLAQGSLNHKGSVMPLGAQSPWSLQTTEQACQLAHSLLTSRVAGDRGSCSPKVGGGDILFGL